MLILIESPFCILRTSLLISHVLSGHRLNITLSFILEFIEIGCFNLAMVVILYIYIYKVYFIYSYIYI